MSKSEIRWYKGKWKVQITLKSKLNYRVRALTMIPKVRKFKPKNINSISEIVWLVGEEFTTVPRLLWRKPRNEQAFSS